MEPKEVEERPEAVEDEEEDIPTDSQSFILLLMERIDKLEADVLDTRLAVTGLIELREEAGTSGATGSEEKLTELVLKAIEKWIDSEPSEVVQDLTNKTSDDPLMLETREAVKKILGDALSRAETPEAKLVAAQVRRVYLDE